VSMRDWSDSFTVMPELASRWCADARSPSSLSIVTCGEGNGNLDHVFTTPRMRRSCHAPRSALVEEADKAGGGGGLKSSVLISTIMGDEAVSYSQIWGLMALLRIPSCSSPAPLNLRPHPFPPQTRELFIQSTFGAELLDSPPPFPPPLPHLWN